jgi:PPR repeat family
MRHLTRTRTLELDVQELEALDGGARMDVRGYNALLKALRGVGSGGGCSGGGGGGDVVGGGGGGGDVVRGGSGGTNGRGGGRGTGGGNALDEAYEALARMKRRGLRPDAVTYNTLVDACCCLGKVRPQYVLPLSKV